MSGITHAAPDAGSKLQPVLGGEAHQAVAALQAELGDDAGPLVVHGARAHAKLLCDLLRGAVVGD